MGDQNIRALSPKERADRDVREAMHYDTLYAEIEQAEIEAHNKAFPSVPYKPDPRALHSKVLIRLAEERVGL